MANRYIKLYELPCGRYASGAPVMIEAGALLQDTISKGLVCQVKFRNLGPKTIRSLKLSLRLTDSAGRTLGKAVTREYLDLAARQDAVFGQKTALRLPIRNARAFEPRVTELVFDDGTLWQSGDAPWEEIAKRQLLSEAYGDEEMATQFRIRYGRDCVYAPLDAGPLWFCTCGAVNRREEKSCHHCRRVGKALLAVNPDSLRHERDKRLEQEGSLEAEETAREEKREGLARFLTLFLPALLLVAALIFVAPRLLNRIVPLPALPEATAAPSAEPAADPTPEPTPKPTPEPTPEPTLSPEEMQRAAYDRATELLNAGSYSEARAAFLALGDYRDCAELAQEAVYRKAMALYSFIEQYDEREVYASLSVDSSAPNRFSLSTQKALDLGSSVVDVLRAACGGDTVDLALTDAPSEGMRPLANCVKDLFSYLGDYRDSPERVAELDVMTDYTRDFYMLCGAGDIYGAYSWLENYSGDFQGREHWLQLLNLYKPLCDDWTFHSGDPTLLPLIRGSSFSCNSFSSRVILDGDTATLRLLIRTDDTELIVDFRAETGTLSFATDDGVYLYFAAISQVDRMALMKYANGNMIGSCDYDRTR